MALTTVLSALGLGAALLTPATAQSTMDTGVTMLDEGETPPPPPPPPAQTLPHPNPSSLVYLP